MTNRGAPPDVYDAPPLVRNPPVIRKNRSYVPLVILSLLYLIVAIYLGTPWLWSIIITIILLLSGYCCYARNDRYSWWIALLIIAIAASFFLSVASRFSIAYHHALALGVTSIIIVLIIAL